MPVTLTPGMTVSEIEGLILQHGEAVFAPGRYAIERPIVLKNLENIRLTGMNGARLSGARQETVCWTNTAPGRYEAQLAPGLRADRITVGGREFIPARYPHYDPDTLVWNGWAEDALDFAARSAHPEDGFLHAMHAHMWGDFHYRIAGRREDGSLELVGGEQNNRRMGLHRKYRYVENLFEALGADGEFFYDPRTGVLYLCSDSEPAGDLLLVCSPCLIRLENCRNVSIEGPIFEDTARTFMEEYEPLLRSDWCIHRGGALFAEGCEDVSLVSCEFTRIGSNAVFFSGHNERCSLDRCFIHDTDASGVCFVGRPSCVRFPCMNVDEKEFFPGDLTGVGPKTNEYPRDCRVVNCLIRDIGRLEKQVSCVEISMSARITVSHCTMHTCPRAAVNISEGTFGGHIIEYCEMFDTVRETGDHGSFNGWGRDRFWHASNVKPGEYRALALLDALETTVIRYNRVRCDHGWDIDLDDGCSNYLVEGNLCLNGGLKFREGFCRTARHNVMINNSFHSHVWFENSGDRFEENLVMRPYKPVGMPAVWGDCIDNNLLAIPALAQTRPAQELAELSGQDARSVAADVQFDENLLPASGPAKDWFPKDLVFGVTSEQLRALAGTCPTDAPVPMQLLSGGQRFKFDGMEFKSVETEGEMSAFATPGLNGAILTSVPEYLAWHRCGLRENTAIIAVNGELLENAEQLLARLEAMQSGDKLRFTVRDMQNGEKAVSLVRE